MGRILGMSALFTISFFFCFQVFPIFQISGRDTDQEVKMPQFQYSASYFCLSESAFLVSDYLRVTVALPLPPYI